MSARSPAQVFQRETLVRWRDGKREPAARIVAARWRRGTHDRLHVRVLLPDGGELEIGNFDLILNRWSTARGTRLPSHARGEAVRTFVMACVHECAQGGGRP